MCINKETAVEGATLGRQKNGRTPTRRKKNKRGTRQMERKMEDDWRTRWRRRPPDVRNRITGGRGERRDARRSFSFGASFLAFSSSVLGLSHHPSLRDGVCAAGDGFFFLQVFFSASLFFSSCYHGYCFIGYAPLPGFTWRFIIWWKCDSPVSLASFDVAIDCAGRCGLAALPC